MFFCKVGRIFFFTHYLLLTHFLKKLFQTEKHKSAEILFGVEKWKTLAKAYI